MSRLALVLAALALSLSGCAAYGGDFAYPDPGVRYYERYPIRIYYDDDRSYHRWHRDRYQERRHSYYAPGYDGRYQWQDGRRHERYERYRDYDRGYQPQRYGWDQRYRGQDRRERPSWQQGGQRYDGYPRRYEGGRERDGNRYLKRGDGVGSARRAY